MSRIGIRGEVESDGMRASMRKRRGRRRPGRPATGPPGRAVSVYLKPAQAEAIGRAAVATRRARGQFLAMAATLEAEAILERPPEPRGLTARPHDHLGGHDASAWFRRDQLALCRRAAHYRGRTLSHFIAEAAAAAATEVLALAEVRR